MEVVFLCPAGGGVGVYGGVAVGLCVGYMAVWRCVGYMVVCGICRQQKKSKNLSIFALSVGLHGLEP